MCMRGPGPVVVVGAPHGRESRPGGRAACRAVVNGSRAGSWEGTSGRRLRGAPRRGERVRGAANVRDRWAGGSAWCWVVVNGDVGWFTGGTAGVVAARCAAWSTTARRTTHVGRPRRHPCVQGPAARCRCPRAIPLRSCRWGLLDPVPGCRRHVSPDKHRAQRLRPWRRTPGLHPRSLFVLPSSPSPGGPCSGV